MGHDRRGDRSLLSPTATPIVVGCGSPDRPCAQLPPAIAEFSGRSSCLADIRRLIGGAREESGPRLATPVVVLAGPGGAGKTTLAVHAAHQLRALFPDGQLYAELTDADGCPVEVCDALGRFLAALGVDSAALPAHLDERRKLFLSRTADRRILVVLDNATSEVQVRPLLPAGARCAVLVTCRSRLLGLEGADTLDIGMLPPMETDALLSAVAGPARLTAEPDAARRIVEFCGGLPPMLVDRLANDRSGQTDALRQLMLVRCDQGRLAESLHCGIGCLWLVRSTGDCRRESYVRKQLADVYRHADRYPEAHDQLVPALRIAQELADRHWQAHVLRSMGETSHADGELDAAQGFLCESLALFERLAHRHAAAYTMCNLGNLSRDLGQSARARDLLSDSLATLIALGDRRGQGYALLGFAGLHRVTGQLSEARACFQQALELFGQLDYPLWQSRARAGMCEVDALLGRSESHLSPPPGPTRSHRRVSRALG